MVIGNVKGDADGCMMFISNMVCNYFWSHAFPSPDNGYAFCRMTAVPRSLKGMLKPDTTVPGRVSSHLQHTSAVLAPVPPRLSAAYICVRRLGHPSTSLVTLLSCEDGTARNHNWPPAFLLPLSVHCIPPWSLPTHSASSWSRRMPGSLGLPENIESLSVTLLLMMLTVVPVSTKAPVALSFSSTVMWKRFLLIR